MSAVFVVGIDLGTTHTVVASAKVDGSEEPTVFPVPQLVAPGTVEPRPLLASALYAPLPGEVEGDPAWIVGELSLRRGVETAGRFVASAKSWLSHAAVDRLAPILPWGAPDEAGAPRVSPVDASARILAHVRDAWDRAHPEAPLAEQEVVVTLPASFDDVARALTLRAAEDVGLRPTLLEEPTAAFYDAMSDERALRELAAEGERRVLVCDVGGGTTDLSLMVVAPAPEPAPFHVRRAAVGRHILLGGDNMDLALAHLAESRLGGSEPLAPDALAQLVASCRAAKERLFAGGADEARVSVLGRGSKLVSGARSATLTKDDVDRVVVEGFFPEVTGDEPLRAKSAFVAFGLPYEREPAITRHVRQFLRRHASELPSGAPDAVLFNGGVFHARPIAEALLASLIPAGSPPCRELPSSDPIVAVARGAVRYGLSRHGRFFRVESSTSRGYYVALASESKADAARAVCIVPRGAKEGEHHEAGRAFELVVGRSVRFDLYASDVALDEAGAIVALDDDAFERLPPVVTRIAASTKESVLPVHLGGELLPTGQVALSCTESVGASAERRRFQLEFQLREATRSTSLPPPASVAPVVEGAGPLAATKRAEMERIVLAVFGKKPTADDRAVKDVVRDLEKALGERSTWTMTVSRALVDLLLENPGARRRSDVHERQFWLLLGYGLRPGFGDPTDEARVARAFPLFEGRLAFPNEARGHQQFFIAFRRMSGGMTEAMQISFRDAMDGAVAPPEAGLKKPKRPPLAIDELLATLASFERVPAARRAALGEWLVERTWTSDDPRLWSWLARVGARVPLYASVHHVVSVSVVEPWIERLLRLDWSKVPTAPHAAVQLARVTDDRARDVGERLRREIVRRLEAQGAKPAWITAVRELVSVDDDERAAILGEDLPIGLRLSSRGVVP